jgi:hypothetical protein
MFANLLSLVIVGSWFVGFHLMDRANRLAKTQLVAPLLLLLFLNYWRFMRTGDADELIRSLEQEKRGETRLEEARLFWYVLASLATPFLLSLIARAFQLH